MLESENKRVVSWKQNVNPITGWSRANIKSPVNYSQTLNVIKTDTNVFKPKHS